MGEVSAIAWTNSTFNPWIGCTKVGPGCDNCYAENMDSRKRWGGVTHWGIDKPRMRTSAANWKKPLAWNAKAETAGKPWRVFCASLADVFDNEIPQEWRNDLFSMIEATPHLTWQLLTKRVGNVLKMVPRRWQIMFPPNVWMGATMVNQDEYNRDVRALTQIPARIRWLSIEPQLGPIELRPYVSKSGPIDWVVTGGESGAKARPYDIEWARSVIQQCRVNGAKPFVKQLGSRQGLRDRAGADPTEWPEDIRIQRFPA